SQRDVPTCSNEAARQRRPTTPIRLTAPGHPSTLASRFNVAPNVASARPSHNGAALKPLHPTKQPILRPALASLDLPSFLAHSSFVIRHSSFPPEWDLSLRVTLAKSAATLNCRLYYETRRRPVAVPAKAVLWLQFLPSLARGDHWRCVSRAG